MESLFNFLPYIGWVLLAIMVLVFVHELGHFLFAKLFKMKVEKFSIGFPPKVIGKKIGETEYVLGLTPLGGYVKITGMVDESMDTDMLESEPQPWEFRAKPVWQRIIVITAGVVFNMLLAAGIFISLKALYGEAYIPAVGDMYVVENSLAYDMGLRKGDQLLALNGKAVNDQGGLMNLEEAILGDPFTVTVSRGGEELSFEGPPDIMTQLSRSKGAFGVGFDPPLVGTIVASSAAEMAGLRSGDRILAINGTEIHFWNEMTEMIQTTEGETFTLRWERPDSMGGMVPATATVLADSIQHAFAGRVYEATITPQKDGERYVLGVYQLVRHQQYGFGEALAAGTAETWLNTKLIVTSLKRVFTGQESFRENVGGPIMIAKVTKEAADAGAPVFWNIVAMLSITLAIINILPIPALDGGHLVFLMYEGITRREPSLKVRMALQQVGMVLLLAFMTFVIFNDILRL